MRHCLTLDLKDDPELIAEYEEHHRPSKIPEEIVDGIREVGIKEMEIYRWDKRLFMIIDTDLDLDDQLNKLAGLPGQNKWEKLMDRYQERLEEGKNKWIRMSNIFKLSNCKD